MFLKYINYIKYFNTITLQKNNHNAFSSARCIFGYYFLIGSKGKLILRHMG